MKEQAQTNPILPLCSAPCGCGQEAKHEAILEKTGEKVLLCDLCFTRHALRGLLKTAWLGKIISRPM